MIWKGQKAGDQCKGCQIKLIDQPWIDKPNKTNAHMRWLLHEDTLLTICSKE